MFFQVSYNLLQIDGFALLDESLYGGVVQSGLAPLGGGSHPGGFGTSKRVEQGAETHGSDPFNAIQRQPVSFFVNHETPPPGESGAENIIARFWMSRDRKST